MNHIEIIITILLLLMVVPDLCARLGRPALAYSAYVLAGMAVGPLTAPEISQPMIMAGQVGFLLLLFEVGLEIDLPSWRDLRRPLWQAGLWFGLQIPLIVAFAHFVGFSRLEGLLAASALTACSIGMAHAAWKTHPGLAAGNREELLRLMVVLETMAIVLLSVEGTMLTTGFTWRLGAQLGGVCLVIWVISRLSPRLSSLFQLILEKTTHWRVHLVALLVFLICAVGQRFGLSGPKTAFFLGLFLSRIRHDGRNLEEYIAPISRRLLIPLFFFSLGLRVDLTPLAGWALPMAAGAGVFLVVYRLVITPGLVRLPGGARASLLLGPNLPIAALAADLLLQNHARADLASGLLVISLVMTIGALWLVPKAETVAASVSSAGK